MTDYDITFCEGLLCPRRHTCHRYLHFQVYLRDRNPNKKQEAYIIRPRYGLECPMYWPEKLGKH